MARPNKIAKPTITTVDILDEATKDALRKKAQEKHAAAKRESAEDAFLSEALRQEQMKDIPADQLEFISLDLAGHSQYLMLDGVRYFHGETYEVPRKVADSMREMVFRGWTHEDEIGGANRDQYHKPRHTVLSPTGVRNAPLRA